MKYLVTRLSVVIIFLLAATYTHAQFSEFRNFHNNTDFATGVAGVYTTTIYYGPAIPQQFTSGSTAFLFSFRDHPSSLAGVEFNYQYSRFSQFFRPTGGPAGGDPTLTHRIQNNAHEASAAYLIEPHMHLVRPFLAVGGGSIYFNPDSIIGQWRGMGLAEVGFDADVSRHLAIRIEGRSLFYRAPAFNIPPYDSHNWLATAEPVASYVFKF